MATAITVRHPRPSGRGALSLQLVLVATLLVATTAFTVANHLFHLIGRTGGPAPRSVADVLPSLLAAALPLAVAGALLTYLLALRVRASADSIARAAGQLRLGHLDAPIPQPREAELAPLAGELSRIRVYLQEQIREQVRATGIEEIRQRALLDSLRDPVITASPDDLVVTLNPPAVALFGGADPFYRRPVQHLLPFITPLAAGERSDEGALDRGARWQGKLIDARGLTVELEVRRMMLAQAHPHASVSHVYVLHHLAGTAGPTRLREQLLSGVTYELRAPLTLLQNALELLDVEADDLSADEFDQLVRTARRGATRLLRLTQNLATASAIQSGHLTLRPTPTDVAAIVEDALGDADESDGLPSSRVVCRLPRPPFVVDADRRLISQVLASFVVRAARYAPGGEPISLRAERVGADLRIAVETPPPATPSPPEAALLRETHPASPAADPGLEFALGLARGIVEAHGGLVAIEQPSGHGTRAWLTLPLSGTGAAAAPHTPPDLQAPPERTRS